MNNIKQFLDIHRERINHHLENLLPPDTLEPSGLHRAMRYAVMNGGKRIRPAFVYATGLTFSDNIDLFDLPAAAVELIHCYSLVHDDLPAMDDDDLRRGQPTCHKAFNEATAILVGDALQALAFELLSMVPADLDATQRIQMLGVLANASGSQGMAGGQALDLSAEGNDISLQQLEMIHHLKTGAIIRASVQLGAISANCDLNTNVLLDEFASNLGLAFQIQDDILDIEGNTKQLGKQSGADVALHKATYPAITNLSVAKQKVIELQETAKNKLKALDADTTLLSQLADFIVQRNF